MIDIQCSSKLLTRTKLGQMFKNHARDILQGKVLNVEGVVDVLTLKDNTDTIDDYATALHLLARAEVIPRHSAGSMTLSLSSRASQMLDDYHHSEGLGVECTTMTSTSATRTPLIRTY